MSRRSTRLRGAATVVVALALVAACSGGGGEAPASSGSAAAENVEIEIFQSKSEAVEITDELIGAFEAENPGITVTQTNVPDDETVLQARIVKNDIPDVIAVNAGSLRDVASAGILADLAGTEAEQSVTDQSALETIQRLSGTDERVALPWTVNALVVMYNKATFDTAGVSVPTTWSEFLGVAQALQDSGVTPFYHTWKDAWTAKGVFNSIAGQLQGPDAAQALLDGDTTFATDPAYRETAQKLLELKPFGQDDLFGKGYADGNASFANGESAMYINGIWAIPEVLKANPDIDLGTFVLPASDDVDTNAVVSGPDSFLAVAKDSPNIDAAKRFVGYLLSQEAQQVFTEDQHLFSVRDDVPATDTSLADIKSEWLDQGRVASYPDLMFNGNTDLSAIVQAFLQSGDVDGFLQQLDDDFAVNALR